jgi:hypothetical protein
MINIERALSGITNGVTIQYDHMEEKYKVVAGERYLFTSIDFMEALYFAVGLSHAYEQYDE